MGPIITKTTMNKSRVIIGSFSLMNIWWNYEYGTSMPSGHGRFLLEWWNV